VRSVAAGRQAPVGWPRSELSDGHGGQVERGQPPLRLKRTPAGIPIGIPPYGGQTCKVTITGSSSVAPTTLLHVERNACLIVPAPSILRPDFFYSVSSTSNISVPAGQSTAPMRATSASRSAFVDQRPAHKKRGRRRGTASLRGLRHRSRLSPCVSPTPEPSR